MNIGTWIVGVELGALALVVGFSVWVLVVQPLALVGAMPRPKFLGLQMRIVRVWARAVVVLTALALAASLIRTGVSVDALAPLSTFAAATLASLWALPRALRAGGDAVRLGDGELSGGDFILSGGGQPTHLWHRVVLALLAVVLAGVAVDVVVAVHALGRGL